MKPQSDDIAGAEAIYGKKGGIGSPSTSVGVTPYNPPDTQATALQTVSRNRIQSVAYV